MEIDLQTRMDDMLSLDFGGVLTLECDASGLRLPAVSPRDEILSLLARNVRSLRVFIDQSSVEIFFINGGEGVMSRPLLPGLLRSANILRHHAGRILLLAAANLHGRISVLLQAHGVVMKPNA
jgi:sucrose-6-phosphate hydrolase SacC (GH32 family)